MAVVVRARDIEAFSRAAARENLTAAVIAKVTSNNRLVMRWKGRTIVDIDRAFLDTAGASRSAKARITQPSAPWDWAVKSQGNDLESRWLATLSDLSVASQRGLAERFDGSIGAASVLFPEGGSWQSTPECGMAARIPVTDGKRTVTTSLMSMGYDPRASRWSPFHGAQYAVLESLTKILALGGDPRTARLSFQEYFERTVNGESWGKPAAALLGALEAQLKSGAAAIGGKDSMSGTFHDLSVPPTLVSFAVAVTDDDRVRGGSLTQAGNTLILVRTPYLDDNTPDWAAFRENVASVLKLGDSGTIRAAYPVIAGGIAAALSKMAFGNRIGAKIDSGALPFIALPTAFADATHGAVPVIAAPNDALFAPLYGSLILEVACDVAKLGTLTAGTSTVNWIILGKTDAEPVITVGATHIPLDRAQMAWEKPLASVFPPVSGILPSLSMPAWASGTKPSKPAVSATSGAAGAQPAKSATPPNTTRAKTARPLVVLPVFPGTNCEYDMARAFRIAGADTEFAVIRNKDAGSLAESLAEFREKIDRAQILAFSGGFSAGDEPDGSGKFIANVIREARVADGIMELFESRKGLILGICNGFQALIKTGLVPYGKILPPSEDMPTLTYNLVGRHISRFVSSRIASDMSPWANDSGLLHGKIHRIPVSHGEGRVIIAPQLAESLFAAGQIFTQYVDGDGKPTMTEPDNPNGSMYAIEGMTDPSGRILGKMGHNERPVDSGSGARPLYRNIPGDTCQNIFAAGVRYWKD
jgi:phosphoribosylformylglycinamidine synthase